MPSGRRNRDVYTAELVLRTETKRFSTHFVQTPDAIFHGTVADMGYAEQSIPVPAGIPRIGDCRIVLDDSKQEWRALLGTVVVNRCLLRIHRRKEGTSTADLVGIYEISDDWQFTQDQCIVQGRNIIAAWWEAPLLANLINRTNFPDLAEIDEAFPNIIMGRHWSAPENPQGRVRFAPMPETDHGSPETITRTRWCVAAHPVFEVVNVYRRQPGEGTFTPFTAYTINQEQFFFDDVEFNFTFMDCDSEQQPGTEFQGDVDGYNFRGDFGSIPQYTNTEGPIRNAVDHLITIFYLRLVTELHSPAFDIESFLDVMTKLDGTYTSPPDFEYLCDILFDQQISTGAAVAQILESQEIYLTQNRQGEIALRIILAGDPDRPVFNDNLHHLKLSVHPALAKPVYNRWRFFYDGNKTTNQWQSDVIDDEVAQNAMAVSDGQSPETITPKIQETVIYLAAVNDLDTAIAVINRRRQFESLGSHRVTLRVPTPENYTHLECAKLIGITSKFGIGPGGWNNAEFIVTDVVDQFAGFYSEVKGILRSPVQYGAPEAIEGIGGFWAVAQGMSSANETFLRSAFVYDTGNYDPIKRHWFGGIVSSNTTVTTPCEIVDANGAVVGSLPVPANLSGQDRQWLTPAEWFPHQGRHTYHCRMGNFPSGGVGLGARGSATWAPLICDPELVNPDAPTKVRLTYDLGGNNEEGPNGFPDGGDGEDGSGWVNRAFDYSFAFSGVSDGLQTNPNRWCPFYRLDSKWSNKVSAIYWETVHGWGGIDFDGESAVSYIRLADTAPPGSAIVSLDDDFDRGSPGDLDGQTASGGFDWTRVEGSASLARIDVSSDLALVLGQNVACSYRAEEDLSSVDHSCEADVFSTETANLQAVCCRFSSSEATYYVASMDRAGGNVLTARIVAGAATVIDTFSASVLNDGTHQRLKLSVTGSTLKAYLDGVLVGTSTDSNITTGTRAGMRGFSSTIASADGGFNDFTAYVGEIEPGGGGGDDFELIQTSGFTPNKATSGPGKIRIDHLVSDNLIGLMPNDEYYGCSVYRLSSFVFAKAFKAQMIVVLDDLETGDTYEQPYTLCRTWLPTEAGVMMNRRQAIDLTNAVEAYLDVWGWMTQAGGHGFKLWDAGTSNSGTGGSAIDLSEIEFTEATRQFARSSDILAQLTHGNRYGISFETAGGLGEVTGCAMLTIVRQIP